MKRFILALAIIAAPFATPAFGQSVTATLPVTCPSSGVNCVQSTPVVNPDGTNIGGGGGTYTGPVAAQLPATLGAKTGALSLSVVPNTDTAFPISAASLPLPAGAATAANQTTFNGTIGTPGSAIPATGLTVGGTDGTNYRVLLTDTSGRISVNSATASNFNAQAVGNVASGATDSGNPVKIGGVANSSAPTAVTAGQRVNLWTDLRGAAATFLTDGGGTLASVGSLSSDALSTGTISLATRGFGYVFNSTVWERVRTIVGSDGTGLGIPAVAMAPQSSANGAITPVVGSLVSSINGKGSAGNLYAVTITTAATAGYLYVFNSTTLPADGVVTAGTASGNYQICTAVSATTTVTQSFDIPERYSAGIRPAFSTTACGTLTNNTTATFMKARVQ